MLAAPDALVDLLLAAIEPGSVVPSAWGPNPIAAPDTRLSRPGERISVEDLAQLTMAGVAGHRPTFIRLNLGWPGSQCRFEHPLDYIGFDGGGGLASGPGMAVGAALALKGSGRLPVAMLGDGDYVMGCTALWTAVHYRWPLLVIIGNNASFFNDELHQERVARMRSRPVENRAIGLRMDDPPLDLATLARGQGCIGHGPIATAEEYEDILGQAIAEVEAGAVVVIDVHVAPEYARGLSAALLRQIPAETEGKP
jgi:thiamine pyrophosphate-dependent acetolactate synthase large subunit-like protein